MAIKDLPRARARRASASAPARRCVDEFKENEDLPNTTNPDDWARISGKKGERIVYIRTLVQGKKGTEAGRSIDTSPTPASTSRKHPGDVSRPGAYPRPMSARRVMGIETEYGISLPGQPGANAMLLCSQIVNAYAAGMPAERAGARWDFEEESPLRDARGFELDRAGADPASSPTRTSASPT
jgi:hypothetical protein